MGTPELAIVVTITLAFVGYLATYVMQRRVETRTARLERLNLQIRNLYGPLYATLKANDSVWGAFVENCWPAHGGVAYFGEGLVTTADEDHTWRLWMLEVFEPLNARIENLILENGDLIEGHEFPDIFIEALAHIAAYRALYRRWNDEDFRESASVCNFPSGLSAEVANVLTHLLEERRAVEQAV